jgi:hypothetical protein
MYGVPQMAYSQPYSLKGKEVTRWPIYETPDQDPGYGKGVSFRASRPLTIGN